MGKKYFAGLLVPTIKNEAIGVGKCEAGRLELLYARNN